MDKENTQLSQQTLIQQWRFFAKRYSRTVSRISSRILSQLGTAPENEIKAKALKILSETSAIFEITIKPLKELEEEMEAILDEVINILLISSIRARRTRTRGRTLV